MIGLVSQLLYLQVMLLYAAYEFIKTILKGYEYCKKVMKKHFNKNLVMSEEED